MVFSSPIFLFLFLPITISGYYLTPTRFKNLYLLLASYVFYAWGSYEFVLIFFLTSLFDYFLSYFVADRIKRPKTALIFFVIGIISNVLLLGYFKYANFFVEEFSQLFGLDSSSWITIILPLGISFFTFQKISYLIDVYKGKDERMKNIINYFLYIVLFPQLIAGPIVRFDQINKQIVKRVHSFDKFFNGIYLFVIGLSMKVLIADPLGAVHIEVSKQISPSSTALAISILAYGLQIYFDFAGYSKMAIGIGKMFGFKIPQNFNRPYLSRSITEFWRRWHITLSSFLKEYVYFPLGGSRCSKLRTSINLLIVFLLTGIWHGANWTFLIWGLYFGLIIVLEKLFLLKILEKVPFYISRLYAVLIVFIGWILFQAESFGSAVDTFISIFSFENLSAPIVSLSPKVLFIFVIASLISFVEFDFEFLKKFNKNSYVKALIIIIFLFTSIISIAGSTYHPFLYFRF